MSGIIVRQMPLCSVCGCEGAGIDALCNEHRKQKRDTKKCGGCNRDYDGKSGWIVPKFDCYIDIFYRCPQCLLNDKKRENTKKKRITEINKEIGKLKKQLQLEVPSVYVSDGEYYHTEEYISFSEFMRDVEDYKTHESIYESDNKIRAKITSLEDELDELE